MDVSNRSKSGMELIDEMAELTGLPKEVVKPELIKLSLNAGLDLANVTLDDLRPVLFEFMSEMVLEHEEKQPHTLSH